MVNYKAIEIRRKNWDASHPPIFTEAGGSRGLHERLKLYIRTVKKLDDDSTEAIRKLENIDGVVAEVMCEIRKRSGEDDVIEDDPSPEEVRKQRGRILKRELQTAIDKRPDTLVLISKADMESEAEIAGNPARKFEQGSAEELLRNIDKELKSVFQRSSRPRVEEDTISEELDVEPKEGDPDSEDVFRKTTGVPLPDANKGNKSKVTELPSEWGHAGKPTAMVELEDEMRSAIDRLLPSDNYISADLRAKIEASRKRLLNES